MYIKFAFLPSKTGKCTFKSVNDIYTILCHDNVA